MQSLGRRVLTSAGFPQTSVFWLCLSRHTRYNALHWSNLDDQIELRQQVCPIDQGPVEAGKRLARAFDQFPNYSYVSSSGGLGSSLTTSQLDAAPTSGHSTSVGAPCVSMMMREAGAANGVQFAPKKFINLPNAVWWMASHGRGHLQLLES